MSSNTLVTYIKTCFPWIVFDSELSSEQLFADLRYKNGISEKQLMTLITTLEFNLLENTTTIIRDFDLEFLPKWSDKGWVVPLFKKKTELVVASSNPYWNPYRVDVSNILYCPEPSIVTEVISKKTTPFSWLLDHINKEYCSDIHMQEEAHYVRLLLRKNGQIQTACYVPKSRYRELLNIIKLQSHMNVGESHRPQDGRLILSEKLTSSLRVATLPTPFGEDIALRKVSSQAELNTLNTLGFSKRILEKLHKVIELQSGLILITGATGSGKTTTLYALLRYFQQTQNKMITTLENPVENIIPGIRQSQINDTAGYTFESGLKAILRQDPDIIMIGEIRDAITAQIALHAAYTGHLVLASLHTENCENTLMRLISFNCDTFLLAYCLKVIIAQKLIPVPCTNMHSGIDSCPLCYDTGFKSRRLLSEFLQIINPVYDTNLDMFKRNLIQKNIFIPFESDLKNSDKQGIIMK